VTSRELRLRRRIDKLTDERDAARAKLEQCRQRRDKLRERARTLDRSLELWRLRALNRG
jgi:uncharacterized coiled-coil DUF342 family protein